VDDTDELLDILTNLYEALVKPEELARWAEGKRVAGHLTNGKVDPAKCQCAKDNCRKAQATANLIRRLAADGLG
jgi:hypothetical protein